ncbi:MAG TPA: DUF5681 domain-containing protein [Lysobacter sp.]
MAFAKGKSGNPAGRPKADLEVRDAARLYGSAAITKLVELMEGDDKRLALAAAQALLDRGFGKPAQSVELTGADGGAVETVTRIELVAGGNGQD